MIDLSFLPFDTSVTFFGNSIEAYLIALLIFIVVLVVFGILQFFIVQHLKKIAKRTKTDIDDTVIAVIQSLRPPFYSFLALFIAINFIELSELARKFLYAVLLIWIIYQIVIAAQIIIDYVFKKALYRGEEEGGKVAVKTIKWVLKTVIWSVGLLLVLSNLGVNITSLIAGLGIGGIAIALAAQNILADLFSSFAIIFDKPFVPGDVIKVGDHVGLVKKIGIKTTRIQALQGEEVIISNQELTSSQVQNFKRMQKRRVTFSFGVTYDTSSKKLEEIPEMVRKIVDSTKHAQFDRVHFNKFDDSALNFECVYYAMTPDFGKYMNINQEILFAIKREFEKKKIEMAFPTRTIYMQKG